MPDRDLIVTAAVVLLAFAGPLLVTCLVAVVRALL